VVSRSQEVERLQGLRWSTGFKESGGRAVSRSQEVDRLQGVRWRSGFKEPSGRAESNGASGEQVCNIQDQKAQEASISEWVQIGRNKDNVRLSI